MAAKPTYEELEQRVKELKKLEAERKQADAALKESETKFRSLFNLSPQAVALTEIEKGRQAGRYQ